MIISERYGPQFDAKDGTVGKLKLVKAWAIARPDPEIVALKKEHPEELKDLDPLSIWWGRDGGFASKKLAEAHIKNVKKNNPPERVPEGMVAVQAWYYPNGQFCGMAEK